MAIAMQLLRAKRLEAIKPFFFMGGNRMFETISQLASGQIVKRPFFRAVDMEPKFRSLFVARAIELLEAHSHFKGRCGTIEISQDDEGHLVLEGKLPNFYLKQLAQECLRSMQVSIRNEIVVAGEIQSTPPRELG